MQPPECVHLNSMRVCEKEKERESQYSWPILSVVIWKTAAKSHRLKTAIASSLHYTEDKE